MIRIKKINKNYNIYITVDDTINHISTSSLDKSILFFCKTYIHYLPNELITDIVFYSSCMGTIGFYMLREMTYTTNYSSEESKIRSNAKHIKSNVLTFCKGKLKFTPYQLDKVKELFSAIEDFYKVKVDD